MGSFEATIVKNSQCFQVIVRCVWQLSCIFLYRTAENSPRIWQHYYLITISLSLEGSGGVLCFRILTLRPNHARGERWRMSGWVKYIPYYGLMMWWWYGVSDTFFLFSGSPPPDGGGFGRGRLCCTGSKDILEFLLSLSERACRTW